MFEDERIQQMFKMAIANREEVAAYTFSIAPKSSVVNQYITVHVKPFTVGTEQGDDEVWSPDPREAIVQDAYFTPERIAELKRELIKRIEETDNPFAIWCSDYDEYEVDKDKIFEMT